MASFYSQDSVEPKSRFYLTMVCLLDTVFACVIVAPITVWYWRATWEVMAYLLLPTGNYSPFISFFGGLVVFIILSLTQNQLTSFLDPNKRRMTYFILSRIYTELFAVTCINMWRGAWSICDFISGETTLLFTAIYTSLAFAYMLYSRSVRNLLAAPFLLFPDWHDVYFVVDNFFQTQGSKAPGLFILDTFYSVFIISVLVVVTWRGVWGIFDLTFYTDNILYSAWGSTILGYSISILGFILQPFVQFILENIKGKFKIIFISDVFMTFCFLGAINIWRGIWMMADVYILPDDFIMSCWITHALGYIVLVMLNCSNTLIVRGVLIDGQEKSGECVSFPNRFIRVYFERQREKKYNYLQLQQQQSQSDTPEKV
ncbi:fusl family protein [Megaselia abdita]